MKIWGFYFQRPFLKVDFNKYTIQQPMGHSEDDAVHKIHHKMKTHWQNQLKISVLVWFKILYRIRFKKIDVILVQLWNCFTCRNLFQNGANDMSECLTFETAFCKKKLKILYCSDHPILIKFRQLVVNIVIKEMVFLTSTVINSNGNMKELERKIKCEKLMFW